MNLELNFINFYVSKVMFNEITKLPVEDVVNLFPDVSSKPKKLSINAMQDCFKKVTFTRVL